MARYVVPPKKLKTEVLLKCFKCGCLYAPDGKQEGYLHSSDYESCPACGYRHNTAEQAIPLWRYNLIKWVRGGFNGNKGDQRSNPEQCECIGSSESIGSER